MQLPRALGRVVSSSLMVSLMVSLLSFSCQSQLWAENLPNPKGQCRGGSSSFGTQPEWGEGG